MFCSSATVRLSYTQRFTQLFLDQAFVNTISGFTPNANTADPNWGRCLQCAAIDRARYKLNPVPPRSTFCSQCFQQYCFDPQNPPSQSELPNRKLVFVDPDPVGIDQVEDFLADDKYKLVGGLIGLSLFVGLMIFGLCVCVCHHRPM
jgi:lysophospholipase